MSSVLIVQERVPSYRVEFFTALRHRLQSADIELQVAYSQPSRADATRSDTAELDWCTPTDIWRLGTGSRYLSWQNINEAAKQADYIVLEYGAHQLASYPLMIASRTRGKRFALWGHGANLQSSGGAMDELSNLCRRTLVRASDWCFAYTAMSATRFADAGASRDRITVVQNSADAKWSEGMPPPPATGQVCAFLGSLHAHKKLDMLIDAAELLGRRLPGFELRVVGDGPMRNWLLRRIENMPYVRWYGYCDDLRKRDVLEPVTLLLNPGLVGLVAVDSFASGRPLTTTSGAQHSPEIEYVRPGENGYVFDVESPDGFAECVISILADRRQLQAVTSACRADAKRYSLEVMVENFAAGIANWISSADRRFR